MLKRFRARSLFSLLVVAAFVWPTAVFGASSPLSISASGATGQGVSSTGVGVGS